MLNKQIENSLGLVVDEDMQNCVREVLNANQKISNDYKQDLSQRYRYMEFNQKDYNTKEFIELIIDALNGKYLVGEALDQNGVPLGRFEFRTIKSGRVVNIPLDCVDNEALQIVHKVVNNYADQHQRLFDAPFDNEKEVLSVLNNIMGKMPPTTLETAIKEKTLTFNDFSLTAETAFLCHADNKTLKPLEVLLHRHGEMNLLNQIVEQGRLLANPAAVYSIKKNKP